MRTATISILGLYNWNQSIFDGFHVPEGVDKDICVNNIFMECSELEVIYNDPLFMQSAIEKWSKMMAPVWSKLYETTQYDYDPIENYNRTEEWTENEDVERNRNGSNTRTDNLTQTGSGENHRNIDNNDTRSVAAFNSENFANAEKNVTDGSIDDSSEQTVHNTGTQKNDTSENETEGAVRKHSAHMFGNIGVTTTQQMITEQREVVEFNIYRRIVDDFKTRFCLLIY